MSVLQGTVYTAELIAGDDLTGATVTATVTAPDLTISNATATIDGKTATVEIPATQIGTYLIVWSAGVADQFTVEAASIDLISLTDLREELNIRAGDTSKDAKLRRWMRAANGVVENVTGPIRARTEIETFDGGTTTIVLGTRWVSAITTIIETVGGITRTLEDQGTGSTSNPYGYLWDRTTNVISRRTSGGTAIRFASGLQAVTVTYIAGLTTIPEDIQLATAELIKHWFKKSDVPSRGVGFGAAAGDEAGMQMVGNYMLPNAVMELLEPWRRPPGIA